MKIIANENLADRFIRVILGEVFFLIAFFWVGSVWSIIFYILATIMFVTSITGFCYLYKLLGIDTSKQTLKLSPKLLVVITSLVFLIIAVVGSYYSNFFTKKIFLEDYNKMNNYYKQALFYSGKDKRSETQTNYDKLVGEYQIFLNKYLKYRPYVFAGDNNFSSDLLMISNLITEQKEKISTADLKVVHLDLEKVRPIFQDILKRNGFSLLAVSLVDFHDAMEKIIEAADAKDSIGLIAAYPEADEKLKEVENTANDAEIQAIRTNLNNIYNLAKENKADQLSVKAAELKSSFVKVYLKRG